VNIERRRYGGPAKRRSSANALMRSLGGGPSVAQIAIAMMKAAMNEAATRLKFIGQMIL